MPVYLSCIDKNFFNINLFILIGGKILYEMSHHEIL